MRRVSKAKAASMQVEARKPLKRKADDDEVGKEGPAVASVPKNGKSATADNGDESDEAESFEVESILSSRVRHGKQQFKIRWKGFGPADDTWEDEENVDSPELIAAFLQLPTKDAKASKSTEKKSMPKLKKAKKSSTAVDVNAKKVKYDKSAENVEYEVSKIIDYVELKDGTRQFLVRWKGFSAKDNTWEPEANLNCPELIKKYLVLEQQKEDTARETREVRQQVNKYNPELTKRRSHRSSTKKRVSYHDLE